MPNCDGKSDSELVTLLRELSEAVSLQAKIANKLWIALITVAVINFLPVTQAASQPKTRTLPFNLGEVDSNVFGSVAYLMLVVIVIAFAAAHAQQIRSQRFVQLEVSDIIDKGVRIYGIHPRDLFDLFRMPSLTRVASLPQLLRGKDSSFTRPSSLSPVKKILARTYYVMLKIASLTVYFGLPTLALVAAYLNLGDSGPHRFALTAGGVLALVSLLQVAYFDSKYIVEVIEVIGGPDR